MAEIGPLDHRDPATARALLELQRAAYRLEAELIGSGAIPPLHETLAELVAVDEIFLGARIDRALAGAISWKVVDATLDVHRLIVSPASQRNGLGRRLLRSVLDAHAELPAIVQTGADNHPARALYASEGFAVVDEIEPAPGLRVVRLRRPPVTPSA